MEVSLVSLLVLLYISHYLAGEDSKGNLESTESNSSPRKSPPYLDAKNNLYYYYNKSAFPNSKLETIFRQLKRYTCLEFKPKWDNPISHKIGINFNISGKKSTVELSTSKDCPTNVTLKEDDFNNSTLLRFYIGIALDIIPEVRRPDRDIDVNVTMDNVEEEFMQYYNITNSSYITYLNDTEFDFRSPMFFGPDFGSKNKRPTYKVKLYKKDQYPPGRGRPFRHNFYKYIFYYYCNGSTITNKCKYGGYPNPSDHYKCKCSEHFSGTNCTEFNKNSYFTTNYTTPAPLEANSTKHYYSANLKNTVLYLNITSKNGRNVSATIQNITFSETNCSSSGSSLEVLTRKDKGAAGIYFCKNSTNVSLPPLSNEMFFVFNAKNENIFLNVTYKEVKKNKTTEISG
uniref:Astacin domain-containing protein n=1 Tax=Strongyloides papillosus TaxID=174720 RepID=A0A0N5C9M7_STREA